MKDKKYPGILLIYLFTFLFPFVSVSQPSINFDHLTINHGLSNNTVNCVFKDSYGFLWFGTNDGLNKYDGYSFTVYRNNHQDTTSIVGNKIYTIIEDNDGALWIGTKSGLSKYIRKYNYFESFTHIKGDTNSLRHNFIKALHFDEQHQLWIGTLGGGLNLYTGNNTFKEIGDFSHVSSILSESDTSLWIATTENGIYRFGTKSKNYTFFPFQEHIVKDMVTNKTLFSDSKHTLWVCTEGNGLFRFNRKEKKIRHFSEESNPQLTSNIIQDIIEVADNEYWIATDGGGINSLNLGSGSVTNYVYNINTPNSLTSDGIYALYKDNHDIIWIGTFGGGLNIFNRNNKQFKHFTQERRVKNTLSHKSVLCFYENTNHKIWIGTDGGGLNLFDPEKESFTSYNHNPARKNSLSSNVITSLFVDDDGVLWAGTYAGGLNKFDVVNNYSEIFKHNPVDSTSITNNNVWDIEEDKYGNLWIATLGGLSIFDPETSNFEHVSLETDTMQLADRIITLFYDKNNNMWIGSNYVAKINGKRDVKLLNPRNADENLHFSFDVRCIYENMKGDVIWIATEGGGLLKYIPEKDSIFRYTTNDGLPNNSIHQIQEDNNGFLWLSSNKGLSRFNPDTYDIKNYDVSDGLQSNQFSYSASLKTDSQEFYFGGINGFNVFVPDSIKDNPHIPPVLITDFLLSNKQVSINAEDSPLKKHISLTDEITLPFRSVFTLEYTALNYTSPRKNQYRYKLEGFSGEWNNVGTKRTATYTNLDPGEYIFKVMGSNNDGKWNKTPATLKITILPPFYKTTIAYILYVLATVGLLLSFRSYLINRQKIKHDLMLKDIERKKIEEVNQMKLRFFTNISHEFRTPLTLIIGPLENIIHHGDISEMIGKQLRNIHQNAQRLLRLINQLMEFRRIETGNLKLEVAKGDIIAFFQEMKMIYDDFASEHKINYRFISNTDSLMAYFDRDKLDKIFYNLLSNAFKFTPDNGKVTFSATAIYSHDNDSDGQVATSGPKTLEVIVEDNGAGISKERLSKIFQRFYQIDDSSKSKELKNQRLGSGIGLSLTKELVELHKGKIFVESKEGVGTKFIVFLPLEKAVYKDEQIVETDTVPETQHKNRELYELFNDDFDRDEDTLVTETDMKRESFPTLLVVEDNAELRQFIRFNLCPRFNILEAENGLQGYEIAKNDLPDLIISDIMMPVMDGLEFLGKVRNDKITNHIPVILLTAKTAEEHVVEGIEAGAEDYIIKPFNPRILFSKIVNIIESRKNQQRKLQNDILIRPENKKVETVQEKFIKKAMSIVESHVSDSDFDVSVFVSEMGMSRSVLYRKMDAIIGQSANEFIRNIRLKRAAQLLEQNQMTVSEVAYEVGFNDPQYFSKCFNKKFGKTPSSFATSNQ